MSTENRKSVPIFHRDGGVTQMPVGTWLPDDLDIFDVKAVARYFLTNGFPKRDGDDRV